MTEVTFAHSEVALQFSVRLQYFMLCNEHVCWLYWFIECCINITSFIQTQQDWQDKSLNMQAWLKLNYCCRVTWLSTVELLMISVQELHNGCFSAVWVFAGIK